MIESALVRRFVMANVPVFIPTTLKGRRQTIEITQNNPKGMSINCTYKE
jgi:hypothetical protein